MVTFSVPAICLIMFGKDIVESKQFPFRKKNLTSFLPCSVCIYVSCQVRVKLYFSQNDGLYVALFYKVLNTFIRNSTTCL